jgi:large subunit ribosomal protein L18
MSKNAITQARRQARTRRELKEVAYGRPRLSVFRSAKQIYVQVIDDVKGHTVAAASSVEKDIKKDLKTGSDVSAAKMVGKIAAERALKAGVKQVVFDRGSYLYHGRVKAVAEGAREGGLDF